jgi:hypothetical protein
MKERKMYGISKGIWGAAFVVAVTSAAFADASQTASLQVQGSAPKVCTLGDWTTSAASSGTLSSGSNAVVTFSNADLVAADGTPKQPGFTVHTPIMCNTAMTIKIRNDKGGFINDAVGTVPAGFANKWSYNVVAGTVGTDGTYIYSGYMWVNTYLGQHFNVSSNMPLVDAAKSTYVQIIFNLYNGSAAPITGKMMAGTYSEGLTLSVSPTL